jgi:polar amino acid transport system ATP-binding protein
MTTPQIIFQDIHKAFDGVPVLQGFSLEVAAGEHLSLIGPSGSGKSTILRLLMTLESPDAGRIAIDGEAMWENGAHLDRAGRKRQHHLRRRVGMVFQHFHLFPHLRVLDNLTLAPVQTGLCQTKQARDRAVELLDQVGLADKAEAWPDQLSGGQKQRVAIARALAMQPDIMLFDEPTSALDPELVGEVLTVIRDLASREDMTMLLVTHQMDVVRAIADRVCFLDGGLLVEQGSPDEILDRPGTARIKQFLGALS